MKTKGIIKLRNMKVLSFTFVGKFNEMIVFLYLPSLSISLPLSLSPISLTILSLIFPLPSSVNNINNTTLHNPPETNETAAERETRNDENVDDIGRGGERET